MQHSPVKTWKDGEEKERIRAIFLVFVVGNMRLDYIGEAVGFC